MADQLCLASTDRYRFAEFFFHQTIVAKNASMSNSNKTLISIATFDEIENLPRLVDEIKCYAPDVDIQVVDDNSPDGTGQWCKEQAKTDASFHCIHRASKLGLGTAAITGMNYAIRNDYKFLVNLDADFSHHPRYLPVLINRMDDELSGPVDVAIASRYIQGGGIIGWPPHRRWMSRGINLCARTLLGLRPRDCSGSYRCYRVATLRKIDISQIRSRGYSFYEEILLHLQRVGARMAEIPILFVDRQRGQTKINSSEAIQAMGTLVKIAWSDRLRPSTSPLHHTSCKPHD